MLTLIIPSASFSQQILNVSYIEYPPYYYSQDEKQTGFLLQKIIDALDCAGVKYTISSLPSNRAIFEIKEKSDSMSIGWFKNPERELFAKYSDPIYKNKPARAVFNKNKEHFFSKYNSLYELLTSSNLTLGVISGHSEGQYVDDLIKSNPLNVIKTSAEQKNIVHMLAHERFDYILLPPEEFEHQIIIYGDGHEEYMMKELTDMPPGNNRYLIFSKDVSDDTIRGINDCLMKSECER